MSLTLYVAFVWQFFYEVKSCRILKNLWLLTSYKNCDSKELASREWVSKIINLNLADIRFKAIFSTNPTLKNDLKTHFYYVISEFLKVWVTWKMYLPSKFPWLGLILWKQLRMYVLQNFFVYLKYEVKSLKEICRPNSLWDLR